MDSSLKNNLAFRLNEQLLDATEQFFQERGNYDIEIALGAANLFISSLLSSAPSKHHALATLKGCHEIQRNTLRNTPDRFFGNLHEFDPAMN